MVQDILVYLIVITALIRTIYSGIKFIRSAKRKSRLTCNGCTSCTPLKL